MNEDKSYIRLLQESKEIYEKRAFLRPDIEVFTFKGLIKAFAKDIIDGLLEALFYLFVVVVAAIVVFPIAAIIVKLGMWVTGIK